MVEVVQARGGLLKLYFTVYDSTVSVYTPHLFVSCHLASEVCHRTRQLSPISKFTVIFTVSLDSAVNCAGGPGAL